MRDVDFLFVYDVKNREFENISLLGAELERRGYKVGFQSFWHSYTHRFYTKYRTKVAVLQPVIRTRCTVHSPDLLVLSTR